MTRAKPLTLDQLPLFASDVEIAQAVVGPERAKEFIWKLPELEARGFPKISQAFGGRYVPLVKAYFERSVGGTGSPQVMQDRPENPSAWKSRRSKHPV